MHFYEFVFYKFTWVEVRVCVFLVKDSYVRKFSILLHTYLQTSILYIEYLEYKEFNNIIVLFNKWYLCDSMFR